ncbi:MAG: RHS repeat-associated core domain-containing protein [Nitrospirae bacterium]|nr:RHS repeat-associated core domain-containing protein [Nitrospirota bacterium]
MGGLLELNRKEGSLWKKYSYLYDGKGNVSAVIDSAQIVVASYSYDPYGNVVAQTVTSGFDQPYMFSTKRYYAGFGLYYFGYRFYSPSLGRWINRDPMGEDGGLNLYVYLYNGPVGRYDPMGLNEGDNIATHISRGTSTIGIFAFLAEAAAVTNPKSAAVATLGLFADKVSFSTTAFKGDTAAYIGMASDVTGFGTAFYSVSETIVAGGTVTAAGVIGAGTASFGMGYGIGTYWYDTGYADAFYAADFWNDLGNDISDWFWDPNFERAFEQNGYNYDAPSGSYYKAIPNDSHSVGLYFSY